MFIHSLRHALPLAVLLAASVTSVNAHADSNLRSTRVGYADLNLASESGVKLLYARVQRAARSVCGPPRTSFRTLRNVNAACIDQAMQQAIDAIDVAALTEHDLQRRGVHRLTAR